MQIPFIFKFFDFYFLHKLEFDLLNIQKIINQFFEYENHKSYFDTQKSIHLNGRLGPSKNKTIVLCKKTFKKNLELIFHQEKLISRSDFIKAFIIAYEMTWNKKHLPKTFLMHLHHGDWLTPESCIEKSNLYVTPDTSPENLPNKILIALRNPADALDSVEKYVQSIPCNDSEKANLFEKYLILLIQDWLRIKLIKEKGIDQKIIRLEDLRKNTDYEIKELAKWLNIVPDTKILTQPTFFGETWWGDQYSQCNNKIHSPVPPILPNKYNQDHVFLYSLIGGVAAEYNYQILSRFDLQKEIRFEKIQHPKRKWQIEKKQQEKILSDRIDNYKKLKSFFNEHIK